MKKVRGDVSVGGEMKSIVMNGDVTVRVCDDGV